ncbi:hypothetical protein [Myxococcus phage Mx1]|nr:hypothetical protein [Myxococcus phage Mx1]
MSKNPVVMAVVANMQEIQGYLVEATQIFDELEAMKVKGTARLKEISAKVDGMKSLQGDVEALKNDPSITEEDLRAIDTAMDETLVKVEDYFMKVVFPSMAKGMLAKMASKAPAQEDHPGLEHLKNLAVKA